ncbi:MAG TPA: FxsC protein [Vicinamibacterales bacterium]|nr:FxsC protein [Vicinamibacterales bacterium]
MAYDFFLSYTRANNDAFLRKFYVSLQQAITKVRTARQLPIPPAIGFFDQRELELGEDWDASIVDGLQTSSVFIAVVSPEYFKSLYCAKECKIFRQRLEGAGRTLPSPLVKPIYWSPFNFATAPPIFQAAQLLRGDLTAVQNTEGYRFLLQRFVEHEDLWDRLILDLAGEIIDAGQAQALNPLADVPKLASIDPEWMPNAPAQIGPKRVKFAYMASDPSVFGAARDAAPYQSSGGADWRPFYPKSPTSLHTELQQFVNSPELEFTSDELPVGDDFIQNVEEAEKKRQLVVLFVDGWSLQFDQSFRQILDALDRRLDYHWCVIVPNNDEYQPDSASVRPQIDAALNASFGRHVALGNPLFFRTNIKSTDDLKKELADVLIKLKEEVKKRASVEMPVPAGPSRAVVRGQATKT